MITLQRIKSDEEIWNCLEDKIMSFSPDKRSPIPFFHDHPFYTIFDLKVEFKICNHETRQYEFLIQDEYSENRSTLVKVSGKIIDK